MLFQSMLLVVAGFARSAAALPVPSATPSAALEEREPIPPATVLEKWDEYGDMEYGPLGPLVRRDSEEDESSATPFAALEAREPIPPATVLEKWDEYGDMEYGPLGPLVRRESEQDKFSNTGSSLRKRNTIPTAEHLPDYVKAQIGITRGKGPYLQSEFSGKFEEWIMNKLNMTGNRKGDHEGAKRDLFPLDKFVPNTDKPDWVPWSVAPVTQEEPLDALVLPLSGSANGPPLNGFSVATAAEIPANLRAAIPQPGPQVTVAAPDYKYMRLPLNKPVKPDGVFPQAKTHDMDKQFSGRQSSQPLQ